MSFKYIFHFSVLSEYFCVNETWYILNEFITAWTVYYFPWNGKLEGTLGQFLWFKIPLGDGLGSKDEPEECSPHSPRLGPSWHSWLSGEASIVVVGLEIDNSNQARALSLDIHLPQICKRLCFPLTKVLVVL